MPPWWFYVALSGMLAVIGVMLLAMAGQRRKRRGARRPAARPELEFVSGPLSGQIVGLERDVTTIGSVAGNTVLLTDTGVSRKHVGIRRVEAGFELADLGSTNGVYVNGEKVARRKLTAGDVIRVGTTEIVFRA
jgi:pSer/pThr/pTyr-binding forkhead associated (FHA) protein